MREVHIDQMIVKMRKERGITQEELADCMGVTKASVSKWETGLSYPDILMLPRLASYFNISIDELMNYTPQLEKKEIAALYRSLTEKFAALPFTEVKKECEEISRKYYSCFPLLLQMAILYLNHYPLAGSKEESLKMLEEINVLCKRIIAESGDKALAKDAEGVEAVSLLAMGKADEVLALLGEEIRPSIHTEQILIAAMQMKKNKDKAGYLSQVIIVNHLSEVLGVMSGYLQLYEEDEKRMEEIVRRTCGLIELFHLESIQSNAAACFYYTAAVSYMKQAKKDRALAMLEGYTRVCIQEIKNYTLHGDDFFDRIEEWFQEFDLGNQIPRSQEAINEDILANFMKTKEFEPLKKEKRYLKMEAELKKQTGQKKP